MNEMAKWELLTEDEQSGWAPGPYPSRTERMEVPGGWIYMRTVWTAIGPHMSPVFVPSDAPTLRSLEDGTGYTGGTGVG